ncbi:MTMRB protein, partial [Rhinopomastus cyanomelas]|nr:MTMRB protein [Rhinopomastus cyanomelas]
PGSRRLFHSDDDVALPCIRKLVAASSFTKPRVLTAATPLNFIPQELAVFCRDFRLLRFYFQESGSAQQALRVVNAIARAWEAAAWLGEGRDGCSCPAEDPLEEEEEEEDEEEEEEEDSAATLLFEQLRDWEKELKRLGAAGWRVSAVNERFDMAPSLPRYLWVPSGLLDHDLKRTFAHFEEHRVPRLCWRHPGGGDLLRAASFHAASKPSSEDVRGGTSMGLQWGQRRASRLGKGLEKKPGCTLVTTSLPSPEPSDRDLNCLVASLVQLLGDPHCRTLAGFQSLVQREWVAAGHPFPHRLGLLRRGNPREEAPVFLLFLDCTWQLLRQFPAAFGFTESYLLALHDSSFAPYSSTFLFSCQRQRGRGHPLRPHGQSYTPVNGRWDPQSQDPPTACGLPVVWHWRLRYSRQQRAQFRNPMGAAGPMGHPNPTDPQNLGRPSDAWPGLGAGNVFVLAKGSLSPQPFPWRSSRPPPRLPRWAPSLESLGERGGIPGGKQPSLTPPGLLLPCAAGPSVRLWRRCYLRGLPEAQRGRFSPSPAGLAEELLLLQERLRACWAPGLPDETPDSPSR